MTPDDFAKDIINTTFQQILNLSDTKGREYAGVQDKFANFKNTAKESETEAIKVLYIFMNKHYNAIQSYVRERKVYSEPIEGRIDDMILYLLLLKGMIKEKESRDKLISDKPRTHSGLHA